MHRHRGRVGTYGLAMAVLAVAAGTAFLASTGVGPLVRGPTSAPSLSGILASSPATATGGISSTRPVAPAVGPSAGFTLGWDGADPTALSLNWTATRDFWFQYYTLYSSTNGSNGPWQTVQVISTQGNVTTSVSGLAAGSTYWWQLNETGSFGGSSSNVLQETQPTLAYLNYTQPTASTVKLTWTNNATYGGLLTFVSYTVYQELNGGSATPVVTVSSVGTRTATVTIGSGSYLYYVTTEDCVDCAGASPTDISTNSNPVSAGGSAPLSNSITVNRLVVDTGQPDLFACTPTGGKSPYRFSWDFGTGVFAAGTASESHAFASAANVTITCQVKDALASLANASVTIQVNSAPDLTVVLNRTSIDLGQSIAFACTVANGTAPIQVGWLFGDGNAALVGTIDHSYVTAGAVVATCEVTDGAGMQELQTASVTVDPTPTATAVVDYATVAPGYVLHFTGSAVNGSGTYPTYAWNFGDGNTSTGSAVTHAYMVAGNYSPTVAVADSHGITARGSVAVQIAAIGARITASSRSIHPGDTVTFTAAAFGGAGGPYNYTWKFGDGSTGYGTKVAHRVASAGTIRPTLVVTDRLGMSSSVAVGGITAQAAPNPYAWLAPWLLVVFAIVVGLVVGLFIFRRHRKAEIAALPAATGWVPEVDPSQTTRVMKVCGLCGKVNVPLRTTCEACGKPLRRFGFR